MNTESEDLVVLLDADGQPCGTADRMTVHSEQTPLHLAFSCYVVDAEGLVLMTRRALTKRTWPGVWTNACCGHPQPGERFEDAIERRLADELGARATAIAPVLPGLPLRGRRRVGHPRERGVPRVRGDAGRWRES